MKSQKHQKLPICHENHINVTLIAIQIDESVYKFERNFEQDKKLEYHPFSQSLVPKMVPKRPKLDKKGSGRSKLPNFDKTGSPVVTKIGKSVHKFE